MRCKASRQSIRSMPQVTRSVEHAGRKPFVTATELFQLVHIMQGYECNALFRYNRRFDVLRYNRRFDAPPTGDDLIVRLHDHRILRWASPPCRTLRWASPPSRILRVGFASMIIAYCVGFASMIDAPPTRRRLDCAPPWSSPRWSCRRGVPMSVRPPCWSRVAGAGVLRPRRRRVGSIVPPPTLRLRASA